MIDKNIEDNKFTWNDLIIIKKEAPPNYFPKRLGVICGFTKIKNEKIAKKYDITTNDWLYTVEFNDGSDILIPEKFLEKYQEKTK